MSGHDASECDITRRILENLNTAVLLFDQDLHLSYINPAGEVMLATSRRQLRGEHVESFFGGDARIVAAFRHALESGHPFTERERILQLPHGQQLTADCTVTPLHEPNRDKALLVEILGVDRQRRILREENLLAQHQATRALVRGLAHEIKNPLGGLRGAAQLLERELADEALKEYTGIIIGEADRLQNLLNRMLGPNTLPHERPVNIHQVLERVRTLVAAEAPAGIRLIRDYDPSIPEVIADPEQLIQAVLNIVRNAVQALKDSGRIVLRSRTIRQVTIGQKRHRLVVQLDIIDNGPGIAPDMLEHIFYPMVTGRAEGTGLGLPIAQALVNQHGGLIECSSEPGETVFTLLLPLEISPEHAHDQ
ncbi:MAG TPA: nitrogen regulation protein NR(II) [Gammaproteobacteria bacterium]|nr:nitrogen regulation protein NR(II) [Gammaproteobacteria bacterium]